MFFKPFVFICSLLAVANAHFQLQYPAPRGPFVASKEPTFCGNYIHTIFQAFMCSWISSLADGYTNVTTNRTAFPLSNGFLSLVSEHENWTAGVIISVFPNPNSFDDFNANNGQPQIVRGYAKAAAAGTYCLPLNISSAGIFGLTDGTDVTIQVVFNGGDGNLYQVSINSTADDVQHQALTGFFFFFVVCGFDPLLLPHIASTLCELPELDGLRDWNVTHNKPNFDFHQWSGGQPVCPWVLCRCCGCASRNCCRSVVVFLSNNRLAINHTGLRSVRKPQTFRILGFSLGSQIKRRGCTLFQFLDCVYSPPDYTDADRHLDKNVRVFGCAMTKAMFFESF